VLRAFAVKNVALTEFSDSLLDLITKGAIAMFTAGDQMKILQMIQDGQITAEEGAKLLAASRPAVAEPKPEVPAPGVTLAKAAPEPVNKGWFRVRVTDLHTDQTKVTVNLPLSLMTAGMKIGARYSPELENIDLTEIMTELKNCDGGKIVDVVDEEDGEHVEIFIG
jgi:hypothetical protein